MRRWASRILGTLVLISLSLSVPPSPVGAADSSGVFRVSCKLSHRAMEDPIVSPGLPSAHMHDFFGNATTGRDSTYDSMVGQPTSCEVPTDTSAFWVPTMLDKNSDPIPVDRAKIYYRDWPDSSKGVSAFPPDFRIISGFPNLQQAKGIGQSAVGGNWGFTCDNTEPLRPTSAINCAGHAGPEVIAVVFFPQCGSMNADGSIVMDSSDHRSHAVFAKTRGCPAHHPVKLPLAYIKVKYAVTDCIAAGCHLSSDGMSVGGHMCSAPGCTLHADFWNTWVQGPSTTQNTLANLVEVCLNSAPGPQCNL